jgi:Tol biopolymer transport system component
VDVRGSVAWSPDGRWVVAGGSEEAGTPGLYKIPADGGPPERILDGQAFSPVWSPDGSLIVYEGAQVQATARLHALRPNGDTVDLPEIAIYQESGGARTRFLADGSGLVYMQGLSPSQDFHLLDIATMKSRRLTRFEDPSEMRTFDITPDGSKIVFDRLRRNSDIVLIELSRPGGGI